MAVVQIVKVTKTRRLAIACRWHSPERQYRLREPIADIAASFVLCEHIACSWFYWHVSVPYCTQKRWHRVTQYILNGFSCLFSFPCISTLRRLCCTFSRGLPCCKDCCMPLALVRDIYIIQAIPRGCVSCRTIRAATYVVSSTTITLPARHALLLGNLPRQTTLQRPTPSPHARCAGSWALE